MPGTRYTSSFDSIERWQGASLPGNLPLSGSYKHYARSASTDSLDSSCTDRTTSSSSNCGAEHYRKVSMEGPSESIRTGIKTPMVNHNPWQFVKVDPLPLYKKAVDQMKLCQETKTVQDCNKEEEELWLKKLDSWKSRRKKVTERTIHRVEDLKLLQEEENQIQRKSKTKTFSEIVENRAQKPRSYNLSIHGENEGNRINRVNSCKTKDRRHDYSSYVFEARRKSEPSVKQNMIRNQDFVDPVAEEFTFNNIKDKFEILEEDLSDNPKEDSAICMEEDCDSCGRYTMDSVLEGFSCSEHDRESRDRSSELSLDTSEDYGEHVNEYELDGHSSIKQGERSEPIDYNKLRTQLQDKQQADNNVQLSMRLWWNSDTEDTDFGLKIREENGIFLVDEVKYQGVAMQSGLELNDRIIAVNEKLTFGRSMSSILFAMKKSVYNGYLDLLISRIPSEGTKESENSFCDTNSGEKISNPSFIVNSQNAMKPIERNDETSNDKWKSNRLNGDFKSSQICKEPESRVAKGCIISTSPPAVDNRSSSLIVGEMTSEKELKKTYSKEKLKFSSPTSVSGEPEETSYGESKLDQQLFLDRRLDHTVAQKNVSKVSSASPSSVIKGQCVQLQSKDLSSASVVGDSQQQETIKPPESEKLSGAPRSVDHVNEENGPTIIFNSHSQHKENKQLTAGFSIKPVADEVLKKTPEHNAPSSNENVSRMCRDNDVNQKIQFKISQTEIKSPENSDIDLSLETEIKLETNRQKVPDELDYRFLGIDSHKKALSPSKGSPKQMSPSSKIESVAFRGSHDFLDMNSADDQMDNDEQKLVTTDTRDTLSRMSNHERSECVQYKKCQANEETEDSLLRESPSLNDEEKLFKEREESLFKRKKEVELEMKILLWEEYKLQKEKEEYRHRVLLEQKNAHEIQSSSGIKLSQL